MDIILFTAAAVFGVLWLVSNDLSVNWWAGTIACAASLFLSIRKESDALGRVRWAFLFGFLMLYSSLYGALENAWWWPVVIVIGILWLVIVAGEGFWLIYEKKNRG